MARPKGRLTVKSKARGPAHRWGLQPVRPGKVEAQDEREKARRVGGGLWEGLCIMKGEDPDLTKRRVDAEIARWMKEKRDAQAITIG